MYNEENTTKNKYYHKLLNLKKIILQTVYLKAVNINV